MPRLTPVADAVRMMILGLRYPRDLAQYLSQLDIFRQNGYDPLT